MQAVWAERTRRGLFLPGFDEVSRIAGDDPLAAQAARPDIVARLLPLDEIAAACWRAISQPEKAS